MLKAMPVTVGGYIDRHGSTNNPEVYLVFYYDVLHCLCKQYRDEILDVFLLCTCVLLYEL